MVYTILISIVFVAEIIIAITVCQVLRKFDKTVIEIDTAISELKPGVKDVAELTRKISEQTKVLAQDFVDKIQKKQEDIWTRQLSKILLGIILLKLNSDTIKRLKKSKVAKTLSKGLSLLELVV